MLNPTPILKLSVLDAEGSNAGAVHAIVSPQYEYISSWRIEIRDETLHLICTYTPLTVRYDDTEGCYFFNLEITSGATNVVWASGKTISDWHNGAQYYLRIRAQSESGFTPWSDYQGVWALAYPVATNNTISPPSGINQVDCNLRLNLNPENITSAPSNLVIEYRFLLIPTYSDNPYKFEGNIIYGNGEKVSENVYDFTYQIKHVKFGNYTLKFWAVTELGQELSYEYPISFSTEIRISVNIGVSDEEELCKEGKRLVGVTWSRPSTSDNFNIIRICRGIDIQQGERVSPLTMIYDKEVSLDDNSGDFYFYDNILGMEADGVSYGAIPIFKQGEMFQYGNLSYPLLSAPPFVFDKVFIMGKDEEYLSLFAGVAYETGETVQKVGVHEPYGSKYPVIIRNANTHYRTGGVQGSLLLDDSFQNIQDKGTRIENSKKRKWAEDFLSDGNPKIIKDWNGNIWLTEIVDNVISEFNNSAGMAYVDIKASWVEIGSPFSSEDLAKAGLSNILLEEDGKTVQYYIEPR